MNPQEYSKLALRTESVLPADHALEAKMWRILHGAIGICTETAELVDGIRKGKENKINIMEEIGDVMWYVAIVCDAIGDAENNIDFSNILTMGCRIELEEGVTIFGYSSFSCICAGDVIDAVKRSIFYRKPLDEMKIAEALIALVSQLRGVAKIAETDFDEALARNIAKLKARYPVKFDDVKAVERDLAKENEALGG